MPGKHTNKLKISLLLRLFVFLVPCFITIYCFMLWFPTGKTTGKPVFIPQSTFQKPRRPKKHLLFLQKSIKALSKIAELLKSYLQKPVIRKKHLRYTLQNSQLSKKRLIHTHKALESTLHNLKSIRKPLKVLDIYPLYLSQMNIHSPFPDIQIHQISF